MKKKKKAIFVIRILLFALLMTIGIAMIITGLKDRKRQSAQLEQGNQAENNVVEWKGSKYTYRHELRNILVLGVKASKQEKRSVEYLLLLSLDQEEQHAKMLQLEKSTIVDLDIYDESGSYEGSKEGPLAEQFQCITGETEGCWAMKEAVSKLLGGLPVDGYIMVDLEGLLKINEALGSEPISDSEDFQSVLTAILEKLQAAGGKEIYQLLFTDVREYVITNLNMNELKLLSECGYSAREMQTLPGEELAGKGFMADQEGLREMIIQLFYERCIE